MAPNRSGESWQTLPALPSTFIGRAETVRRLAGELLCARLVTVTGVGGVGKTRLAIEAARAVGRDFEAVAFADLAPLHEPRLVAPAVAAALGVREEPGRGPVDSIAAALGERRTLLLLDNCEHLLAGCVAIAAALLSACPRLTILATSRERLRIDGEHVHELAPLELPAAAPNSAAALAASAAGALFLDRAVARRADLALDAEAVAAAARICRRLDGLPLALELAAGRARLLSLQQIADRLDDRFRLLVGGRRDAPVRQQTLRAACDWSYELLSADEQAAFRRLSVFPADWDLDAAAAVCATGDGTLDLIDRLVETSLVQPIDRGAERRYRVLETLRAYGSERLAEAGETDAARLRHAGHFLTAAESAFGRFDAPTDARWLLWLDGERANLIAALSAFAGAERHAEALRLLCAIYRVWAVYGGAREGDGWAQRLLPGARVAPAAVRARALFVAAILAREVGNLDRARTQLADADALYRELMDDDGLAATLNQRAILAYECGDDAEAERGHMQGLAHARARGDRRVEMQHLTNLALAQLALQRFAEARANTEAALTIARQREDRFASAICLANLGAIAYGAGELDEATERYQQARLTSEQIGYSRLLAVLDDRLSHVERRRGNFAAAAALLGRSLATSAESGARGGIAETVVSAAVLALDAGQPETAAALWTLGADLLERLRLSVVSIYRNDVARLEQRLHERFGGAGLAGRRAEARLMGWDAAIQQARDWLRALGDAAGEETGLPADPQPERGALTGREREVLRLLAAGRSNKEIAAALVLSVRTVERHIENIYAKTGVHGRAAVTQHALTHQLL